ncbi:MAG: hypothetical protein SGBAC_002049 [Bacillariaceae sp.]
MDVIDLCDSDEDDETDTRDTQNQRLYTNQTSSSPSASSASRAAAAQRPRSISASNSLVENEDDIIFLSDEERQVNHRIHQTRTHNKKARDSRLMSAREKSWAVFQQMRWEAAKEQAETPPASIVARGPSKQSPRSNANEKRKRKQPTSNLEHRKKPQTSSIKPTSSAINAKSYDNSSQKKKLTFLEQGRNSGADAHPTNADSKGATNPLEFLSPFQAVEVFDAIEPLIESANAETQDKEVAPLETSKAVASPVASSGATMNAAIEIDSDDEDDSMEVQPQEGANSVPIPQSVMNSSAGLEATAPTDYHPLLQLGSGHPPGDRQESQSPSTQDSTFPNEIMDSGSVARIRDHRFSARKLIFEVQDHYGAVHRGILLEDLKVDAPALLSNYILKKARGKLAGKEFREWAVKTRANLAKKAMRYMAGRMAHEMDGVPGADAGSNNPASLAGGSSHVAGDSTNNDDDDDDEGELEFELDSGTPNLPPVPDDSETRDIQIQIDVAPEQSNGQLVAPDLHGDEVMEGPAHRPESPLNMPSGNDFEDPSNIENSSDDMQMTGQTGTSMNEHASPQMDPTKTFVHELNEEVLAEQNEGCSSQTQYRTSKSNLVGSRPAYTAVEMAVEIEEEEDDDDEIEVIDVKAPPRREDSSPTTHHHPNVSAEQAPLDTEDASVYSIQSESQAPSSFAPQTLVGSVETPIDIDSDDTVTMGAMDGKTLRDFCTQKRTKGTKPPPPTSYSFPERRFVFHQKPRRRPPSPMTNKWSYGVSCDAAMKEQERLFQASAAKMRSQTTARVETAAVAATARNQNIIFQQVVPNIAEKYPLHWQFPFHSARLGVPEGSSKSVIKKQYRRLALLYHPDKSLSANTATKFQNITESYRELLKESTM